MVLPTETSRNISSSIHVATWGSVSQSYTKSEKSLIMN